MVERTTVDGFFGLGGCRSLLMAEQDSNTDEKNAVVSRYPTKKPYQEPAFRHERVFETMALSCGKISATQFQCQFNRQSS